MGHRPTRGGPPSATALTSARLAIAVEDGHSAGTALLRLEAALRALPLPVIGRVARDRLLLDLRCLEDAAPFCAQLPALSEKLRPSP